MLSAIAFLIFCTACMVLAFYRHPIFGFYFYLATFYVHPPSRWWGYMVPDLRWALLSAVITVLAVWLHRGRLRPLPMWLTLAPAVILLLYNLLLWGQTAWAVDAETNLEGAAQFSKYLVAYWFVYRICDSAQNLRRVLGAHAIGCGLLGIFAASIGREGDRLDGVGGPGIDDANTLGMYLATGTVVCMGLFLVLKGWRRWASVLLAGIILTGFVLANSRGATVGLIAGALALAVCCGHRHKGAFLALLLVFGIGAAKVVDQKFVDRLFTIGDVTSESEDADQSARSRKIIVDAQFKMAADHPLGVGHRGTATLSPLYMDDRWLTYAHTDGSHAERSSHNTFMTVLVEQGVIGVVLYAALLIWLLGSVFRLRRLRSNDPEVRELATLGSTACAAIFVVLLAGMGTDYLLAEVQFWMYAVLAASLKLAERAAPTARPSLTGSAVGTLRGAA
jgi:hypothetical protein